MSQKEITNYSDFWLYYVAEHSHPVTRLLHLIGSLSAITYVVAFIAFGRWYLFPLALIPGYGMAWIGHFFVEKNRPATFKYPLWSFISDWKMIAMMLTGRMNEEVEKAKNTKFA